MDVVFLDLETQRTIDEVGGRQNIRELGLAAAVTYSTEQRAFHYYTEPSVADLIAELKAADLVVGFNLLTFDYEVLSAYTDYPLRDIRTVDMLEHIYRRLGFRIRLNNLAGATLQVQKSADGLQAVDWYRQGLIQKVLDYCQQDVDVTRQLYEYGRRHKHVKFADQRYRIQTVPVSW